MGLTVRAPRPVSFGPPLYLQLRRFPSKHIGIRSLLFRYGGQNVLPCSFNMKFSACVSAAKATSSSITAAATGAAAGGEGTTTSLEVEELREIKDKCRQWKWKGRYAINYFVSLSDPPPSSNPKPKPPLLLVHGFGASILHWRRLICLYISIIHNHIYFRPHMTWVHKRTRAYNIIPSSHLLLLFFNVITHLYLHVCLRNIRTLSQNYTVYAIDLLGFGASEKPTGFSYTMEKWAQVSLRQMPFVIRRYIFAQNI